jgi:putative DNA primase/helicase
VTEFLDAIRNAGYAPPGEIIWDGELHRFATDTAKAHSKDGWYVAYHDAKGRAGAFGSWRQNSRHTWSNGSGRDLTREEIKAVDAKRRLALAEEKRERDQAALRAQRLYEQATSGDGAPYLARKGIQCPDGVRRVQGVSSRAFGFTGNESSISGLLVPMRDKAGSIRSLQIIPDDASSIKLFMRGGQTASCFHALGDIQTATRVLIGEGLATAQSAREATKLPAVVAFSAGNLPDIARIVRDLNPKAEIIIIADDDEVGRAKSADAAKRANGRVVIPGSGCNDFNDLHASQGLAAVRLAILGDDDESDDWKSELIIKHKDDGTQIIPCRVHNLIEILDHSPEFRRRIRFNEFSSRVSVDEKDIDDIGPIEIKAQLERLWIKEKIPTGDVIEALNVVSRRHPFHPIRDYLDGLSWDGKERIPGFFREFFDCPHDAYHQTVGLSLFISSVARIYSPGAKVDTMVILESRQGLGKTKLWIALYGEWCSEVTSSLNDKDFFSGLRGVWCADFGELDQFSRAETTRIKQIITQTFDHYRPHYGRQHQRFPRQCVFVGGTNNDHWQTDPTGARRFLPVRIHSAIDVGRIAEQRDQLWAEAVVRYRREETWWNIPDAEQHQEDSYVGDTWEEVIGSWLTEQYLKLNLRNAVTPYLLNTILTDALRIDPGKHTRADQTRAGNALRRIGWAPRRERVHGTRLRMYYPSSEWIARHEELRQSARGGRDNQVGQPF